MTLPPSSFLFIHQFAAEAGGVLYNTNTSSVIQELKCLKLDVGSTVKSRRVYLDVFISVKIGLLRLSG